MFPSWLSSFTHSRFQGLPLGRKLSRPTGTQRSGTVTSANMRATAESSHYMREQGLGERGKEHHS